MAIRRSTALVNALAKGFGVRELLRDGRLYCYVGSQPTTADTAPTTTNLLIYTTQGLAYIDPVKSFATILIGGAATGTLASVKLGGMDFNLLSEAVSYTTSAAVTADAIVANINARQNPLGVTAHRSGDNVILSLPYWIGAQGDSLTFAVAVTGSLTATASGVFGGGTTAENGLNMLESVVAGLLTKEAAIWQATGLAAGNLGWFRFVAGGSTATGVANTDVRFDGIIATSGGDMTAASLVVELGAVYTITSGSISEKLS
jgi:hypothetical protein